MKSLKQLRAANWVVVIALFLINFNSHLALAAREEPNHFVPEPWYEANPLSRLIASYFAAGYNLLRLDRLNGFDSTYFDEVSYATGTAVGHTLGILGDSVNDLSRLFTTLGSIGMEEDESILQCTSVLPVPALSSVIGGISQLKHTWLHVGDRNYGMPFTFNNGYFGGPAGIMSPDPLVAWMSPNGIICTPIRFPKGIKPEVRRKNTECIASQLSLGEIPYVPMQWEQARETRNKPTRGTILDYNAFLNNCLSAVNYLVSCAGGEISQKPNLGVGGSVPWDKEAFRFMKQSSTDIQTLLPETSRIIFSLGEMKSIALQMIKRPTQDDGFNRALLQSNRDHLIKKLNSTPMLSGTYNELIVELRILDLESDAPEQIRTGLEKALTRINLRLLGEVTGVERTTYQNACESARNACGI
ncbi:MAG: hypothetical protein AABZ55_10930 [Bdellovibrionota bacterium]